LKWPMGLLLAILLTSYGLLLHLLHITIYQAKETAIFLSDRTPFPLQKLASL